MADSYGDAYPGAYGYDGAVWQFITPSVEKYYESGEFVTTLFSKSARGVTVLITDGVATEQRVVSQTEMSEADYVYLGGRTYRVPYDEAVLLDGLGYTVTGIE